MRRSERLIAYSALAALTLAVVGQSTGLRLGSTAAASPAAPAPAAPDAAKIATCDIYSLVQTLIASDQYKPAQNIEQERIKARLAPIEEELRTIDLQNAKLREELSGADSKDAAVQEKLRTYNASAQAFESKLQPYNKLKSELADAYAIFVVGQFYDAHQRITAEAKRIATAAGYTHVIAQKEGDMSGARDPQQLVEDFLARPIVMAPENSDITESVRTAMKLPEKAATPEDAAAPASEKPKP